MLSVKRVVHLYPLNLFVLQERFSRLVKCLIASLLLTASMISPLPSKSRAANLQDALPSALLSATDTLFEQGMADPRGCEYREFEISGGSIWGGVGNSKIHGWLIPAGTGGSERTGIGWNGLVYAVVSVGEKADLRADMLELIKTDEQTRARLKTEYPNSPFRRLTMATSHGTSASEKTLLPLKAVLLLRLNQEELAAQVWSSWMIGLESRASTDLYWKDPYLMLATDWAWALFDRALTSHMSGNDKVSLESARTLDSIQSAIEAEAARRGYKLPDVYDGGKQRYLFFLRPLSALLADQERRAKMGKRDRASLAGILRYTDRGARISALIESLDEVSARQWGQPGGVSLGEDKIVKALVDEGEEAVEPLLRVLESDERLTRSVSFHRDFFYQRHPITVAETAYAALTAILKSTSFVAPSDNINIETVEGRRTLAARIRAYLEQYGKGSLEERWYRVLADDKASREQWIQAAANIVYPAAYEGVPPAWVFTTAPVKQERSMRGLTLRGEPLRSKRGPSVSQLFVRRMQELASREGEGAPFQSLDAATNFALAVLAWDGQAELSEVRSFQANLKNLYDATPGKDEQKRSYLRGMLVSLYLKRFEVNDRAAFKEYGEWISTLRPEEGESTSYYFMPMWRYAGYPEMIKVAARMFEQEGSLWLPLIDANKERSFNIAKLLETPMLNVRSFRERVLEGLMDRTVVGTLRPGGTDAGDRYDMVVENSFMAVLADGTNVSSARLQVPKDDPRAARALEPLNIRACDVYAWKLRRLKGAPRFEIYWTEAERDRAVEEFVAFLRENKGRFDSVYGSF
jgi:hypothetical protein